MFSHRCPAPSHSTSVSKIKVHIKVLRQDRISLLCVSLASQNFVFFFVVSKFNHEEGVIPACVEQALNIRCYIRSP